MKRLTRYLVIVPAIVLVALTACGQDVPSAGGGTGTPTASPGQRTFEETEWTIVTPAGWTEHDITSTADAKKAIRYEAASGEFFIVAIDPMGSDFRYDALWRYEAKGSRFEIVEKSECNGPADQSCSDDDARYDGYVLWKSGAQPPKVGGHTWYFVFGNTASTSVTAGTFEEIAESIRAKG